MVPRRQIYGQDTNSSHVLDEIEHVIFYRLRKSASNECKRVCYEMALEYIIWRCTRVRRTKCFVQCNEWFFFRLSKRAMGLLRMVVERNGR